MDLQGFIDEARLRYGASVNDQLFTDANMTTLVNAAVRQINLDQDWPWMEAESTVNTVSGSNILTLASDVRRVVRMSHNEQEIRYFTQRIQSDFYNTTGSPRVYTHEAGNWKVYPTPDGAFTIDYVYVKDGDNVLGNPTDTLLMPSWTVDAVIARTCLMMARREKNLDLEANYFGEYARLMEIMRDEMVKTTEGMSPRRTRPEDRMSLTTWTTS